MIAYTKYKCQALKFRGYHDFCVDFAIFIHLNPEFTKLYPMWIFPYYSIMLKLIVTQSYFSSSIVPKGGINMKPKYKDFSLPIIGRRYQILYDPDCPDVTYDELKIFIMRLKQEHRYEDVAVLLERYDYLLKDQHRRTKKFNNIIKA